MSPLQSALIRRITAASWASSGTQSRLPAVLLPLPLPVPLSSSSSCSSCRRRSFDPPRSFFHSSFRSSQDQAPRIKTPIGQIQRRLQITFTCTAPVPAPVPITVPITVPEAVPEAVPARTEAESAVLLTTEGTAPKSGVCSHRSSHEFSKQAYEKGLVLIECPACKNRHLIADHLEWFATTPSAAHPDGLGFNSDSTTKRSRTIEDLMREKGEEVKWLKGGEQGDTWTVEG